MKPPMNANGRRLRAELNHGATEPRRSFGEAFKQITSAATTREGANSSRSGHRSRALDFISPFSVSPWLRGVTCPHRRSSAVIAGFLLLLLVSPAEARVGGGHSFSGGRGGGGGGGGGGGDLIFFLIRMLFYYPQIGVPVLILVIAFFIYSSYQKSRVPGSYSSADVVLG